MSETLVPMLPETWTPNTRLAIGSLGGATAAFLTGQDANAAGLTAVNALENNDLAHPPLDAEGERAQQEQIERGKQVLGEGADWLVTEQEDLVRSRQGLIDSGLHDEAYLFARSQDPHLSWWERVAYQERASEAFDRAVDAHMLPTNRLDQLMGAVEVGGLAFSGLGQIGRPVFQGARAGVRPGAQLARNSGALRSSSVSTYAELQEAQLVGSKKYLSDPTLVGEYKQVRGHHVHAKKAFEGHVNYDPQKGFSISDKLMDDLNISHGEITGAQQRLFRELAVSGRQNSLSEHTRIAVEALIEAGLERQSARDIVAQSLRSLRKQDVRHPIVIPWNKSR